MPLSPALCGPAHFSRRSLLGAAAGLGAVSWLTRLGERLARAEEDAPRGKPPRSVIVLWMQGGPSQVDTFDPHPGGKTGGVPDRETKAPGIRIARSLEQMADLMDRVALVRSLVSKEGDHERGAYTVKTGYRPDPTVIHPSLGAIICHQTQDNVEIPRHISLLPGPFPARGGYLGDQFDAFQTYDPTGPLPDVKANVPEDRLHRRLDALDGIVEEEFARGRLRGLDERRTLHRTLTRKARVMMSSEQLQAFDVMQEPESLRREYGENPFGRGCLAAARLVEVGVRCVEVTLDGWDSHLNNEETQRARVETLDPAFAALIRDLERRGLWDETLILWTGEFGRTPVINPAGGRDHWPHGFTAALAGGRIRGGTFVGATTPTPNLEQDQQLSGLVGPRNVEDLHATILSALGIDYAEEILTPIGRPLALSQGKPIVELLASTGGFPGS